MGLHVFADDLSGAMEAGVHLCASGPVPVELVTNELELNTVARKGTTLTCLDVRYEDPNNAHNLIGIALQNLRTSDHIYFKIDSALRGNISSYVAALKDAGRETIAFVGALPSHNRRVANGMVFDGPELITESPLWALEERRPPESIFDACGVSPQERPGEFHGYPVAGNVVVADMEAREDIEAFIADMIESGVRTFVGTSAGLSSLTTAISYGHALDLPQSRRPERLLTIIGSGSDRSREQLARLDDTTILELSVDQLYDPQICELIAQHLDVQDVAIAMQRVPGPQDSQLASQLAKIAAEFASRSTLGLVISGGETASLVLQELMERTVIIRGEIEPSVVWGNLESGRFIAIKPGSHGSPYALEKTRLHSQILNFNTF